MLHSGRYAYWATRSSDPQTAAMHPCLTIARVAPRPPGTAPAHPYTRGLPPRRQSTCTAAGTPGEAPPTTYRAAPSIRAARWRSTSVSPTSPHCPTTMVPSSRATARETQTPWGSRRCRAQLTRHRNIAPPSTSPASRGTSATGTGRFERSQRRSPRPPRGDRRTHRRERLRQEHAGPACSRPPTADLRQGQHRRHRFATLSRAALLAHQHQLGFVPQDPYRLLHPAMTVADLVAEPLRIAQHPRAEHLDVPAMH
jgi:hypothetical protein